MNKELKNTLKNKLSYILCPDAILSTDEQLVAYECDGLTNYRVKPQFVVLPSNTEQVSKVVKLCHEYEIPFVPRGAGTGLSGEHYLIRMGY